jgi:hypothetical protein
VACGTTCPWETCFAARWQTRALRDLVTVEAGHSWKGHVSDAGRVSSSSESSGGSSGG